MPHRLHLVLAVACAARVLGACTPSPTALAFSAAPPSAASREWPSYNRTLRGERFSPLREIDTATVAGLRERCRYDTGDTTSFQSGLLMTAGMLVGTTASDLFALDPETCRERWRAREPLPAGDPLKVNRGAAYLDGRLFRGTQDGRVVAYDAATGAKLWQTVITVPGLGETVPAAPIAWEGRVFIGIAGGDRRGVKGRVYALDAANGRILWEAYLVPRAPGDPRLGPAADQPRDLAASWRTADGAPVSGGATWTSYALDAATGTLYVPVGNPAPDFAPTLRRGANLLAGTVAALDARTGAYRTHYEMVPGDFHDWDVAAPPALVTTRAGRRLLLATPKDGHLYGFDLADGTRRFRTAVTTTLDQEVPMGSTPVRFCPGTQGGAEWNGPAYDPALDVVFTGQVDWCSTVQRAADSVTLATARGANWTGAPPRLFFGRMDDTSRWAGRVAATDVTDGRVRWRFVTPAPILGGVTPTAGGLVFVGDMGGTLYALDARHGAVRWMGRVGGAVGGGVITYATLQGQRIAVAAGMTSPIWPTPRATATVVVLGLPGGRGG